MSECIKGSACFCDEDRRERCGNYRDWIPTGIVREHAGTIPVEYVKRNGKIGFRYPGSRVVYTWEQS